MCGGGAKDGNIEIRVMSNYIKSLWSNTGYAIIFSEVRESVRPCVIQIGKIIIRKSGL